MLLHVSASGSVKSAQIYCIHGFPMPWRDNTCFCLLHAATMSQLVFIHPQDVLLQLNFYKRQNIMCVNRYVNLRVAASIGLCKWILTYHCFSTCSQLGYVFNPCLSGYTLPCFIFNHAFFKAPLSHQQVNYTCLNDEQDLRRWAVSLDFSLNIHSVL